MKFDFEIGGGFVECGMGSGGDDPEVLSAFSARIGKKFRALSPPKDSPITSGHCYTSGVTAALRGAGYYPPLFSLIRSKSSSLCPNACSHSRAQRLPLKGSSKGQSYPECWLESVLRNYANSEAMQQADKLPVANYWLGVLGD